MNREYATRLRNAKMKPFKGIKKLGTLSIAVVESTPVVWKDKLIRFEWARNYHSDEYQQKSIPHYNEAERAWVASTYSDIHKGKEKSCGWFHFVDMDTEQEISTFADDHSFGCCYTENDRMYAYGVKGITERNVINCFVSDDLHNWTQSTALTFPDDMKIFNTSVCKGPDGYVMAIEAGGSSPLVGVPFTIFFAVSKDLIHWEMLPMEKYVYCRDMTTACPTIRYVDGYYYMIYVEKAPWHRWLPYIVRTKDFEHFEQGIRNPVMLFDDDDKMIFRPERFTEAEKQLILDAPNCNTSDIDLCEYQGKTIITYCWGKQFGIDFLAKAEYDGSVEEFLKVFF